MMRFDPDRALPAHLEYCHWQAARWPAGPHSRRLRRALGQPLDALATWLFRVARRARGLADLVHGQPMVEVRLNWAAQPPRRINRYVAREITTPRSPDAPADIAFLAAHPAFLDHVGPETRAAVARFTRTGEIVTFDPEHVARLARYCRAHPGAMERLGFSDAMQAAIRVALAEDAQ